MNPYALLAKELQAAGIDMRSIRINETPEDGSFCILNYDPEVECFFFERGSKYELQSFTDPEAAIWYFKKWVLSIDALYTKPGS